MLAVPKCRFIIDICLILLYPVKVTDQEGYLYSRMISLRCRGEQCSSYSTADTEYRGLLSFIYIIFIFLLFLFWMQSNLEL